MASPVIPARPRLLDGIELVKGPGDVIQLRGLQRPLRLNGRLAGALLPLLDGTHTIGDLTATLRDWPSTQVRQALSTLAQRGVLTSGGSDNGTKNSSFQRSQTAFYQSAVGGSSEASPVLAALREARIRLFGWGFLFTEVVQALGSTGAQRCVPEEWEPPSGVVQGRPPNARRWPRKPFPEPALLAERLRTCSDTDLVVLVLARPAPGLMQAMNRAALQSGIRLLPVVSERTEATVGPAVLPGLSACYECFTGRLLSNHAYPEEEAAYVTHLDRPAEREVLVPEWPPFTRTVAAWATMEIVRLVTNFAPAVTIGHVHWLDALSSDHRAARVWKLPLCPACGQLKDPGPRKEGSEN